MQRLHFICPKTGQEIDVGIDSEIGTLLRIRDEEICAPCPICGERHQWQVRDAQLKMAA